MQDILETYTFRAVHTSITKQISAGSFTRRVVHDEGSQHAIGDTLYASHRFLAVTLVPAAPVPAWKQFLLRRLARLARPAVALALLPSLDCEGLAGSPETCSVMC